MSSLHRIAQRGWIGLLVCLLALAPALGWAQGANDGCDPDAGQAVWASLVQPDGKILIAGDFLTVAGGAHEHLARLNPDCSADAGFATVAIDGAVHALALQADGKIVIGGPFNTVAGAPHGHLARLNADGSPDLNFNTNTSTNIGDSVEALLVQPDDKIVVAGTFTTIGGFAHKGIARLNANGSVDNGYLTPDANGLVRGLLRQPDGKLVISGGFQSVTVNNGTQTIARNRLARLNVDGTLDAFDPDAGGQVNAMALQPDGKIVVGGTFTTIGPFPFHRLARVNPDGSVDDGFDPDVDGAVVALARQPDGKLLLGGIFNTLNAGAVARKNLARLNFNGSVDTGFDPDLDNVVLTLALQQDGRVIAGGGFTHQGTVLRNRIARLHADGSVDGNFNPDAAGGSVFALAVQPDGKLVVGGDFATLAGGAVTRNRAARLNGDGTVNAAFDPNVGGGSVNAALVQRNARVLLGGGFTTLGAISRNRVARILADNTLDAFDPNVGGATPFVNALLQESDGGLVVSGLFASLAPNGGATQTRNNVAYLDGTLGTLGTSDANANDRVFSIARLSAGKFLAGGAFTSIGGGARGKLARLANSGGLDAPFAPNFGTAAVRNVLVQPDGKIVVAGDFLTVNGEPHTRIVRLNDTGSIDAGFADPKPGAQVDSMALQIDGKIVLGGAFTSFDNGAILRNHVARLNANGTLDATFDPDAAGGDVNAVALQADGRIVLGGAFTSVGGIGRNRLARLGTNDVALQSLDLGVVYSNGGARITWLRSGAGAELAQPPVVEQSTNGIIWTALSGTMQRIAGGWRYNGFVPPQGASVLLRASAPASGGMNNGSSGLIASTREFFVPATLDGIFANGFE